MNIEYKDMVRRLIKPGGEILSGLTPSGANLLHIAIGITGEAGEIADAVKKEVIYRKPADRANLVEELGDMEFYLEALRQAYGITRDETLEVNISKLSVRYQGLQYSDAAAQARADKAQPQKVDFQSMLADLAKLKKQREASGSGDGIDVNVPKDWILMANGSPAQVEALRIEIAEAARVSPGAVDWLIEALQKSHEPGI